MEHIWKEAHLFPSLRHLSMIKILHIGLVCISFVGINVALYCNTHNTVVNRVDFFHPANSNLVLRWSIVQTSGHVTTRLICHPMSLCHKRHPLFFSTLLEMQKKTTPHGSSKRHRSQRTRRCSEEAPGSIRRPDTTSYAMRFGPDAFLCGEIWGPIWLRRKSFWFFCILDCDKTLP